MRKQMIISAMLVMILVGTSAIVLADDSSAKTVDERYSHQNIFNASVLSIEWYGTDTPDELENYSTPYYDMHVPCYIDKTAFIYEKGSVKDTNLKNWISSKGAQGTVSYSDDIESGNNYIMYVFCVMDVEEVISDEDTYKNGKDKLHFVVKQDVFVHVFKKNDFSVVLSSGSDNVRMTLFYGMDNFEGDIYPSYPFHNKHIVPGGKIDYYVDCEEYIARAFIGGTFNSNPSDPDELKEALFGDISYSTDNEWKSDGNGSGMQVLSIVLIVIGLGFVLMKFKLNRRPRWSK